jgi:hypothetical protein
MYAYVFRGHGIETFLFHYALRVFIVHMIGYPMWKLQILSIIESFNKYIVIKIEV